MKIRIVGMLVVLVAVVSLAVVSTQSQQPRSDESVRSGRYQVIPAVVDAGAGQGGGTTHELFLVDTQSGRVWRFQAEGIGKNPEGNTIEIPEGLFPVPFYGEGMAKQLTPQK
jgi:hypothetical protein